LETFEKSKEKPVLCAATATKTKDALARAKPKTIRIEDIDASA